MNAAAEWGNTLRSMLLFLGSCGLIHPQIEDIFKAAQYTHCHLELVAFHEKILSSLLAEGPCCHDNSRDECVSSLCPFILLWKIFFFNMFPKRECWELWKNVFFFFFFSPLSSVLMVFWSIHSALVLYWPWCLEWRTILSTKVYSWHVMIHYEIAYNAPTWLLGTTKYSNVYSRSPCSPF